MTMRPFQPTPPEELGFEEITYRKKDWVATVTINRPKLYNCYSTRTLQEMARAFQDASWDDSVAVLVLTGAGEQAFCTGGDVKEYAAEYTRRPREYWKYMGAFSGCLDLLRNLGKPAIARINGLVAGGGNEFNLACDLAVMAEHAYIRQVGTRVGSVAAGGATQWLPITVGDRRAREILFLCDEIGSRQCLEWGLVNRVVPSLKGPGGDFLHPGSPAEVKKALQAGAGVDLEPLDRAVEEIVAKLVDKFAECTRYTKQQVNFWKDLAWHQTIGHARDWLAIHYTSWEPNEGMSAFVEKRAPDYRELRRRAMEGESSEFPWGPYGRTCSACGAKLLPEGFTFCGACGKPMERR
jgi:enoyl-CoA hydratase/carnithine racemase